MGVTEAEGPLADVRVLDLTRLLPGGFCSQMLADFGAEVIKVEDTGLGDYVRWAPPYYGGEEHQAGGTRSALYLSLNRNKRSIRLDLKQDAGREALLRLVVGCDVVLESFRPGVLDRLGVGYERMRAVNPGLVYCAITGYGQTGPNRDRAGHDQNYLALNGILGLTGTPPGTAAAAPGTTGAASDTTGGALPDSRPALAGAQIADVAGGAMQAAFGVMAALHERRRSGEGQLVDVSMTDGSLAMLAMVAGQYLCDGELPRRGEGQLTGASLCYLPYEAADGWVSCGALEPKFWAAFCAGVERPDLIEKQFERPGGEAWREVAAIFRSRSRAEWRAFNEEHDCCIEPVLELDQVTGSELTREREMVVEWEQPGLGTVRQLGIPVKLSRTPGRVRAPAPALG
ncbi:MAG TPA: CoA transferase, partial [Solirubrobacterales bacterium]|nr:CoA transferase [Solirubrobacterales bacterium]